MFLSGDTKCIENPCWCTPLFNISEQFSKTEFCIVQTDISMCSATVLTVTMVFTKDQTAKCIKHCAAPQLQNMLVLYIYYIFFFKSFGTKIFYMKHSWVNLKSHFFQDTNFRTSCQRSYKLIHDAWACLMVHLCLMTCLITVYCTSVCSKPMHYQLLSSWH